VNIIVEVFFSQLSVKLLSAHVLDDQVGGAEVHESFAGVYVAEVLLKHGN
jgi:hypothetical protein